MYKVLLVEDDPSLGYILKEYLELHHWNKVLLCALLLQHKFHAERIMQGKVV